MKLPRILPLVVSGAVAVILASSASPAQALDFNFAFSNETRYGTQPGTVSGTIYGLIDNSTSAATNIIITNAPSASVGYSLPYNLFLNSNININSFTISSGIITAFGFRASNATTLQDNLWLNQIGGRNFLQYYNGNDHQWTGNLEGFSGVTFSSAVPVPFDIPGGATIPTVGSLFALGLMKKAKKSLALKTRIANRVETVVS